MIDEKQYVITSQITETKQDGVTITVTTKEPIEDGDDK